MNTPNPAPRPVPRSPWRTTGLAVVLLGTGFALGAASLASAGAMAWHGGWHHHARIGMIQHVVRNALENVGASVTQEDKIHDIIAATWTDLDKDGADRAAMRKQVLELMKAPTLDKAAIEKVRADKLAEMDAKSKKITAALIDAAGQLTPEQRAKLVQNVEERMGHGGWGWGGRHGHDRMDGPDGDRDSGHHGPDDGDHG